MDEKLELAECNVGPVLAELTFLSDIFLPIKSSARIKYLCFDISKYFIVLGASSGSIYIFQRSPIKFLQVLANKDGAINQISLAPDDNLIGYATSKGFVIVLEHNLYKRGNQTPKRLQLSYEHKGSQVTSLQWNSASLRLFAGDDRGRVSVVNIFSSKTKTFLQLPTVVIMRLDSRIIQLDFAQNKLVASTMSKCYLCDTNEEQYKPIGKKPREGAYGVCFFVPSKSQTPSIYATRPGSRIWEVDFQGTVLNTHQFKDAITMPPQLVITKGCESKLTATSGNFPPQNVQFGKILSFGEKYLITWTENALYVIDPANVSVVLWTDNIIGIREVKIYNHELLIWLSDGTIRNIRLISAAKLTRKLISRQEYLLAAHIAIKYQIALSNSDARHQLSTKLLRQLQTQLLDNNETQLANCIDLITTRIETLDSSSVSSSVSGRSGSTDSFSRHESGVLIVHSSPRNSTSAASDSDDDLFPRATKVRFGHTRSVSGGRYRPGSLPRTPTSNMSRFRPISPGASLTLPRQQRPKSASPAVTIDSVDSVVSYKDDPRNSDVFLSVGREKVGAKISAFERVARRNESPPSRGVHTRSKGRVALEGVSKLGNKVPLANENSQLKNEMVDSAEKLAVTKRLPKKTSTSASNVNTVNNNNKNVTASSEKATITFTFPTYPCLQYGVDPVIGGADDFVSVTIDAPTVFTDLKDSVASKIQSGKQTLRGTVEAIEEKIMKRNDNVVAEVFDVRGPDEVIPTEPSDVEVPKCRQEMFRLKYLHKEKYPKVNCEELISKSRQVLESTDKRDELILEWFKLLNACLNELTSEVLRLSDDKMISSEWENVIFVDDPFNLDVEDHKDAGTVAMMWFKNPKFQFFNELKSVELEMEENEEILISKLQFTPFEKTAYELDKRRSVFVTKFCHLINIDECHSILSEQLGPRFETWSSLIACAQEKLVGNSVFENCLSTNSMELQNSLSPENVCRSVAIIKKIMSSNVNLGIDFCARKSNCVPPLDVMYLSRSIEKSSHHLEVYINKMMTGFGLNTGQTINYLSSDEEFLFSWFSILVVKSPSDGNCSCGYPRRGAHQTLLPNGNIMWNLVRKKCRFCSNVMDLCFKYGYWPGYLYLCRQKKERQKLMSIVVQLGDIELIDKDSECGFFPENDAEWTELIYLVAKQNCHCHNCGNILKSTKDSTITWTRVAYLLLQHWGPEQKTLELLQKVQESIPQGAISVDFLQNFLALVIVKSQRNKSTEVWQEKPSFLGSEMFHLFQVEKYQASASSLDKSSTMIASSEKKDDFNCHWGANLRLHDDCVACCLPLILGTAASIHGVVVLRCGHAFHQSCLEDQICTICEEQ